jgi:hypothetical protein
LLTTKPHAQTPLDASLTTFTDEEGHAQYALRISLLLEELDIMLTGYTDTNIHTRTRSQTCSIPSKSSSRTNPSSISQWTKQRQSGSTPTRASWRCWMSSRRRLRSP